MTAKQIVFDDPARTHTARGVEGKVRAHTGTYGFKAATGVYEDLMVAIDEAA